MTETAPDIQTLPLTALPGFCTDILTRAGFGPDHARAIAAMLSRCQIDDCQSHGLFRLVMCVETMKAGQIDGAALPILSERGPAILQTDARGAMSILAVEQALPALIARTKAQGVAALAVNHCYHFSALWPELETLAEAGLAALAMVPSHAWVAPAGGRRGALGTNPLAFAWPRAAHPPFAFDFATSAFARGEIELYQRAGKPLPDGVAVDRQGRPTTDPTAALEGAMLPFGGHKGSALSIMIELLAGPLIDDLTSLEALAHAQAAGRPEGAPYHGQIILAFDPARFSGGRLAENDARAERLFAEITGQGARLPSQRRYQARAANQARGYVEIPKRLYQELQALVP